MSKFSILAALRLLDIVGYAVLLQNGKETRVKMNLLNSSEGKKLNSYAVLGNTNLNYES